MSISDLRNVSQAKTLDVDWVSSPRFVRTVRIATIVVSCVALILAVEQAFHVLRAPQIILTRRYGTLSFMAFTDWPGTILLVGTLNAILLAGLLPKRWWRITATTVGLIVLIWPVHEILAFPDGRTRRVAHYFSIPGPRPSVGGMNGGDETLMRWSNDPWLAQIRWDPMYLAMSVVTIAAVLCAIALAAASMAQRRHPMGHCVRCGYDLRAATSNTCPECGKFNLRPRQPPG